MFTFYIFLLRKIYLYLYDMYLQMNVNTLIVLFSVLFLISYTSYKIYQKFYSGQHKNTNALYAKNKSNVSKSEKDISQDILEDIITNSENDMSSMEGLSDNYSYDLPEIIIHSMNEGIDPINNTTKLVSVELSDDDKTEIETNVHPIKFKSEKSKSKSKSKAKAIPKKITKKSKDKNKNKKILKNEEIVIEVIKDENFNTIEEIKLEKPDTIEEIKLENTELESTDKVINVDEDKSFDSYDLSQLKTMTANKLRSILKEYGTTAPKSLRKDALAQKVFEVTKNA